MRLVVLAVLGFLCVIILSVNVAFAKDAPDIGYSRLHPASPFYFLKAVKENLQLKLAKTAQTKMLLHLEFATIRLREANTLLPFRPDLVHPTLERYMGELNRLPDKHQVNDEVGFKIIKAVDTHLKVLRQIYPETASPKVKMALRSVMNRLIQRADAQSSAKLPVCALFSREASSSALNEVEKGVLADRADKCFISSRPPYLVK